MLTNESIRRDIARLVIWYPIRWLIHMLPVWLSIRFFYFIGDLHRVLASRSTEYLKSNFRRAFPDATPSELDRMHRVYLQNHYLDRLHIFTYPNLLKGRALQQIAEMEGTPILDRVLNEGKGAIIVLGHYGPIQLPLATLGYLHYPMMQIGLPTDQGLSWVGRHVAFRLRLKYESMIPGQIIPADQFLRPVFQHLKSGGVVMMNIDPAGGGRWIGKMEPLEFLGQLLPFPLGAANLSIKTGAPILPLSIKRLPEGRYLFQLHEPIITTRQSADIVTAQIVTWYESYVRADPGLWHFWDEFEPGKLILPSP